MTRVFNWTHANKFAPALAGDEAYRLFCRPELSPHRPRDFTKLVRRARVHLHAASHFKIASPLGPLQAYGFEPAPDTSPGRNILLVHGWTSEAAFMAAYIEPLRRRGHRLTLIDLPAHGRSPGRGATMIDLARSVLAAARQTGPFDIVIAHSIGGLATLLAAEGAAPLPGSVQFGAAVLIATPNRFSGVTGDFGRHLGLSRNAQAAFERRLARTGHRPVKTLSTANILKMIDLPCLVVHARDDRQVPFSDAEEIVDTHPRARLAPFDNLGHAGVLYVPPAIRIVRNYCDTAKLSDRPRQDWHKSTSS